MTPYVGGDSGFGLGCVRNVQDTSGLIAHAAGMVVNVREASRFMATHARLLDRRRLSRLLGEGSVRAVLDALEGYRNDDGGYGSGLEPDLRAIESQPGGALHAFEVFEEIGPRTTSRAVELCDWLRGASLPDGGLPFALPISDATGCAPFWVNADPTTSSLHITAAITALALRVSQFDPGVAQHPWLRHATTFCFDQIRDARAPTHALVLKYALQFLDAATETTPAAEPELRRLRSSIASDGRLHVEGGLADEAVGPLDFAPLPNRPVRGLFDPEIVAQELDRLEGAQQEDGGWPSEWASYSPTAVLEWRGWQTMRAMIILQQNARLPVER
jgi:hypothetical protein